MTNRQNFSETVADGESFIYAILLMTSMLSPACSSSDREVAEEDTGSDGVGGDAEGMDVGEEEGEPEEGSGAEGGEGGEGGEGETGEAEEDDDGGDMEESACSKPDPGLSEHAMIGGAVAHFETVDYEGNVWNLCELAGKPILVVESFEGCPPCEDFAGDLAGTSNTGSASQALVQAVNEKKVYVAEYLWSGELKKWHDNYPNDNVFLGSDYDEKFALYFSDGQYNPVFGVISPNFEWEFLDPPVSMLDSPDIEYAKDFFEEKYL